MKKFALLLFFIFVFFVSALPTHAQFFSGSGGGGTGLAFTIDAPGEANALLQSDGSKWGRVTTVEDLTFGGFEVSQGLESDASGNIISSGAAPGAVVNIGTFAAPITTNPYAFTALYNRVLWYGATGQINLGTAVAGMNVVIYNTGAFTITVNPQDADVIVIDGTANAAGHYVQIPSGAGNYLTLVADAAGHWVTLGFKGTPVAE